ncbi:two-component system sensor kinase [Pseudonocardia sp. Ae406_Ps2]|uniref:sensor histidine kinase n=1 Tax=unclassified Pseudonocardia TaxID=2619320 RepID=UPI00094AF978|nr:MULTISPECIES: histidine kinase [unclassified Pseudonocardia]OLM00639.1 two-component system sensor kinase [Pseudonocardia sp. Ae406_Ps2]OLM07571.1 two-component system sensor kinase [Pseudonocardia sp. Ae331_Ps2]OLM14758.1 two-component system sensor kinase [Pseudonocardia sp. Ae505_Ps2]OLM22211.1 two-component system sensor kinase [Pseudonocardia sp. Ae706_Ps2]OLM31907.1 two-component system sensor kinase [Pseudonocardia sp. Ae717_Ps2]
MPTAEPGADAPPAPLPGSRAGDIALAVLALILAAQEMVTALVVNTYGYVHRLPLPLEVALAVGLSLAAAAAMLLRRRRPRCAYLVLAVISAPGIAFLGGAAALVWPLLAFSVARAPQRGPVGAAAWVALPWLGSLGLAGLLRLLVSPDVATDAGLIVGGAMVVMPMLVIATIAGRWSRSVALRADRERAETDRLQHGTALGAERSRIAEEIGGGVLSGLRRLVAQAGALGPDATEADLRAVRERARSVLAAMRRVLGVLRAPAAEPGPVAVPVPAPAAPARCRRVPLPDRAGLWALVAFVVPALLIGALVSSAGDVDTGLVVVDGFLRLLQLPWGNPAAALVVAVQFALVAWWRTAPVPALLLAGVASFVATMLDGSNTFAESTWILLVWGAASTAPVVTSAVAVAVSTLVVLTGGTLAGVWHRLGTPASVVVLSFLAVVPLWAAGVAVRHHRLDTATRRRALTEAGVREALTRERLRVARDLHDVVAHHVSAVAVQAGAARLAADPAARAEALGHIADSVRRVAEALPALADLGPDPDGADLSPAALEALVAPSRAAGLPVAVTVEGSPTATPGEAELFARRIVTEALTNTLRHAGPTPTRVRVVHGGAAEPLVVEVDDDGPVPGHRPDDTGSRLGLLGMRERVALVGGELYTGPGDGQGWTVRAVLPRSPLVREDDPAAAPISSFAPIREGTPGS